MAPSFYEKVEDSFCGMSIPKLPGFATMRSMMQGDVPHGADSTLDPQGGEANRQVRLPESLILEDIVSAAATTPRVRHDSFSLRSRARSDTC